MNDIRYEIIIYWSETNKAIIVEVTEQSGCIADSESYKEAIANAKQVILDWIEKAISLGTEIPKPKGELMFA